MTSYDELLKQVASLKLGNTQLHLELQGNSSHLTKLENEASNLKDVLNHVQMASAMHDDVEYSFADETMCREHMAEGLATNFEDSSDPNDLGLDVEDYPPVINSSRGHQRSQSPVETPSGGRKSRENEKEIIMAMQQLEKERINLVQEMEAEEKNRKWYYDQIEMITRKIRSLPVNDTYANQNPGLTRSHLDFEVKRLRETMHQSFGSNEEITQRRENKLQRLRQIDAELVALQQQREQLSEEREKEKSLRESPRKQRSQSPSCGSEQSHKKTADQYDLDLSDSDQVTTATQTADLEQDGQPLSHNISAIYHGAWPINKDMNSEPDGSLTGVGHPDMASVMSFNSTNTSSTHSSIPGAQKRGLQQGHQVMGQPIQQQVGSKVEIVYGLLSMLGTHDKDDMSRTLLAMSSSQDSCIAMRQSGCLPLLIQLLHGSDKDSALLGNTRGSKAARARAAAALHNIVHSHPDDKRGRREARVLRLLEQIRAHCDQLREMSSEEGEDEKENREVSQVADAMNHHPGPAIATLMKLSFDEEHRHAICTLGGLHAIAELLQVDQEVNQNTVNQYNVTMRRYACMALTNLTFGDGTNKALLCSMKPSMEALVAQLTNQNEDLCQVAASVLRNLSWKADLASKKTLREVGAVTTLMESAMLVKKETTLKSILSALWNLSAHCSENKADICAVDGALEFLVSTLTYKSPSKTTSIIENGGGILRNVSSHIAVREEYRKILRQHGCMQILLKHLRSPSLTIVSNACGTLWNLSARCAEDQQALWEMGAVTMLRNLVNSKHKMISMGSSAALKNLLAARPAVRGADLNQLTNANRPSLHVRKQRALEADIDQSLSETCENVESPRDSPVETNKTEKEPPRFVYPIYQLGGDLEPRRPIMRGQFFPRSQSGDNSFSLESHGKSPQRVARSGSQDSVGSTHSDISHDRSRLHGLPVNNNARIPISMGGSLERHKESLGTTVQRFNSEGACERNPLGPPNSRILQVMQEVALHAGIDGQAGSDQGASKVPVFKQPQAPKRPQKGPVHALTPQQAFMYHRIMQNRQQSGSVGGLQMNIGMNTSAHADNRHEEDEKPLDYSLRYRENENAHGNFDNKAHLLQSSQPPPTLVGNYMGKPFIVYPSFRGQPNVDPNSMFFNGQQAYRVNPSYAETDLDDPDQPTDYSARYGADMVDQYGDQTRNYSARYEEPDPNCADCKYEEARRTNDRLEQTMPGFNDDQITMFYTEGTPYLSTATSLTDLSAAVKILEEAEQQYPADQEQDTGTDEMVNFSSKYGESDSQGQQKKFNETDSRAGSQTTDQKTGTTVIANYHLIKSQPQSKEYQSNFEDGQERSFHDTQDKNAPPDQTKTYCEEGTPVCFSRVSSLSSLHSSEAADRQEKSRSQGPLQSIEEAEDMNNSIVKMPPPGTPASRQQKSSTESEENRGAPDSTEKEHKTVTFDEKDQVQETPMMFSRCTSLGSLSSFDTQSVHSSVFSEYSRRASEVVSPSELPDSPSETMPPSPRRTKSPERFTEKKAQPARRELLPENGMPQFTAKAAEGIRKVNPAVGGSNAYGNDIDTDSVHSKSEMPKVYADEGTPPVFSDTLSELSLFSSNDPDMITGLSQKENLRVYADESNLPIYSEALNQLSKLSLNDNTEAASSVRNLNAENKSTDDKDIENNLQQETQQFKSDQDGKVEPLTQTDDKDSSSVSEVSEGEEDILASIISSAMPNSSKKMRKSSSDNAIKKKSANSSKTDSGTSSRSKTPAKSTSDSTSSKNSSASKSVKRCLNLQGRSASVSNELSTVTETQKDSVREKSKGSLQKPKQHRDVKRVIKQSASLDDSTDSARSYADEDNPFNLSSTKTVVTPPVHKSSASSKNPIVHKAVTLSQRIIDEDTLRQYTTEDTPFSGSGPASPKSPRKNAHRIHEEMNDDAVRSYATEDTPFSGSISASPKLSRRDDHQDASDDVVKSYATEDTPFSGSIPASPKLDKKKSSIPKPQVPNLKPSKNDAKPPKSAAEKQASGLPNRGKTQKKHPLPSLDMNSDTVKSFATEDTPLTGSNLTSPKPQIGPFYRDQFNPAFLRNMDNISSGYDGSSDVMKSYATEGTPLNFSRTESFSDLSSINTNIDNDSKAQNVSKPACTSHMDDSLSDNSSNVEDNEELLSELIQAAIPPSKPGKSRRSMDRRPEGAEGKDTFRFDIPTSKPKDRSKFKPLKTSSVSQEKYNYSEGSDIVRTYAVEGTPANFSTATSLSDLTVESTRDRKKSSISNAYMNSSTAGTYGTSNDSVFLQSESAGTDSMKVYAIEGTPQTFSCNESLSSLSIVDEDKGSVSEQIKNIANLMVTNREQKMNKEPSGPKVKEQQVEFRSSNKSLDSLGSARDLERHVIGQSSEDSQSVSDGSHPSETKSDEMKKYYMEGTPTCFSRNSSLSSIPDINEGHPVKGTNKKPVASAVENKPVQMSKIQSSNNSFRNTEFSRNSSHSSLVVSSDDDDPEDLALLDACINLAIPPKSKSSREDKHKNSRQAQKKAKSESDSYSQKQASRNYSSDNEAEIYGSHDSRYSSWRKQPHKSCDEIFAKPLKDAKGRPCRRSRSQDSEKILKHQKELSNKELAQLYGKDNNSSASYHSGYRGSYDSLPSNIALHSYSHRPMNADIHMQQIISESQNLSRSIGTRVKELNESVEKSDENEKEKEVSPDGDLNYFMMCSARTEISVESISKQSFTSIMAPDLDDSILDGSLVGSFRTAGEGVEMKDSKYGAGSCDTTITDKNKFLDLNSEDELALEHNANIVVSELINKTMTVSAISNVEEDRFIENETLSLVSNDYMSDTASEVSATWSANSDHASEFSEGTINSEGQSPSQRGPKILKPGDKSECPQQDENKKIVKGKRKPLYSTKSVSSASSKSESVKSDKLGKQKANSIESGKKGQKDGQGVKSHKKGHALRTAPQACSTPVKDDISKQMKNSPQRQNSAQKLNSSNQKSSVKGTPPKNTGTATRIPSAKTSPRNKTPNEKPQMPVKQGTFIKETTNSSAPVITPPDDKENREVRKRQKKGSDSSSRSRPTSDCSRHSNRNSGGSDSALESWSKALNSYNFIVEQGTDDAEQKKKETKPKRSVGSAQVSAKKNLNSSFGSPASKIPSPNKGNLNKSGSGSNLRQGNGNQILKSNSGSSLIKTNSGTGLIKTGSNPNIKKLDSKENVKKSDSVTSLKSNSRPGTPVNKKGSVGNVQKKCESPLTVQQAGNTNKKSGQKVVGSKISNLWKNDSSKTDKADKQNKSLSKLPVANTKVKSKVKEISEKPVKRESSPRPTVNRNTVILSESTVDGLNRSTTYEKLSTTNDHSQVPTYEESKRDHDQTSYLQSKIKMSQRPACEFEVGVEYSLDDAWSANVEQSIEAMSRSIEEAKNKKDSFYTDDLDISKMNLDESPAKRLSKSGSMSEIELEFGRINSGTWKKKKSINDFSLLPNADETSRTLPLVKRAESLNLSSLNRCQSSEHSVYGWNHLDSDIETDDIWVKRDELTRSGDMNATKSKKKGFRGSSGFLPIKNVVKHVFGSKKNEKDKDKQSKSFSVSDKDMKKLEELKKMSESMHAKSKKEKEPKPSKAELKQLKAELKASKAEAKAEAKAMKKEAKLNKSSKGKNKSKIENKLIANSDCSNSSSSLKKSAEDLIDIDHESDEEFVNMTSSSTSKSESSDSGMNVNKTVNKRSLPQNSDSVKTSVFPQQKTKTSPQAKVPPFNYNPPRASTNTAENKPLEQKEETDSKNVNVSTEMARRKLSLRSEEMAEEEGEGKRKCIVTTV